MNDAVSLLTFVIIFQIIGGIALGWVLRQFLARHLNGTLIFFLIWGSMFSLAPLVIGAQSFAAMHAEYLIFVQVLMMAAVIAITAFTPQEYLSAFASVPVVLIASGGFIILLGAAILIGMVREDLRTSIIVGAVFALVGVILFGAGALMALKNR